ncbi:MAG: HEAT repeat domain-containing protein, partial [Thermodesulfovibrionales bacterium]
MAKVDIDRLRESVVKVIDADGKIAGSGFVIKADQEKAYLITCHHVIMALGSMDVEYHGQRHKASWSEELSDPEVDIAILTIPVKDATAAPIINPEESVTTDIMVYGFPQTAISKHFPEGYPIFAAGIHRSTPVNTYSTLDKTPLKYTNPWNKVPQEGSIFLSHKIDAKVERGTSGGPVLVTELGGVVGIIQSSKPDESYIIRWDNIIKTLLLLDIEPQTKAIRSFLAEVEKRSKETKLFHSREAVSLQELYIPVDVTLERKYHHKVESTWTYAESEDTQKRMYAMKGGEAEPRRDQVSWEEAKKGLQRIVVLSDPGMGKSALLRMEAALTANKERRKLEEARIENIKELKNAVESLTFPLLIRLSDIASSGKEVIEVVPEVISRDFPTVEKSIFPLIREKLRAGMCLLLLDALDEVAHDQQNELGRKLNDRFIPNYPCRIYLTSRIVGYSSSFLNGSKEVEIVPFTQEQIETFVRTWFKSASRTLTSASGDDLVRELKSNPQIHGLAQIPLILSLICSLYPEDLGLPARRTQIYKRAIDCMLEEWRGKRERQHQPKGRVIAKQRLLEELAYYFSEQEQDKFTSDELYDRIEMYLKPDNCPTSLKNYDAPSLMAELTEEDGIIVKLERKGEEYMFLHRTFQEYLTASYLSRSPEGVGKSKQHFWDYQWHETLALMAGLMTDPMSLLKMITDEKDDIFFTQLLLAGRCIAEIDDRPHPLVTRVVRRLHKVWECYPSLHIISVTIIAVGRANEQLYTIIEEDIKNANHKLRGSATYTLKEIGGPRAVDSLIAALSDRAVLVRKDAAEALGEIGDPRAVDSLIAALSDLGSVSRDAAEALGEIGDPRAVDSLIAALSDSDDGVRRNVAEALGKIGDPRALDGLIAALSDSHYGVRRNAAEAIGKIGDPSVGYSLLLGLFNRNSMVRGDAAVVLGEIGDPRAVDGLIDRLRDSDDGVRGNAAEALGKIGDPRAVDGLIAALSYSDDGARGSAAEA